MMTIYPHTAALQSSALPSGATPNQIDLSSILNIMMPMMMVGMMMKAMSSVFGKSKEPAKVTEASTTATSTPKKAK